MAQRSTHNNKVAICLAAYNGVRWLPEQLDSILAQEEVNVTVYVSVDQSSDGTENWVDARAGQDPRIVVLPHGQKFGGAARNFFRLLRDVDFSGFAYVGFADQDDIWVPGKLARAHEILLQSGADAYSCNVQAFWRSGRKAHIRKSQAQRRRDFLFEAAGPGCTYVMKADFAKALQALVRTRWSEVQGVWMHDWLTYAFARANGYKWTIDEYVGLMYRQHAGNQVGANTGWRSFAYRVRKVLSGFALAQAELIARIVGMENDPLVKRGLEGGRAGLLWLAANAGQCRRRLRDRVLFAFACVLLSITMGAQRRR